MDMQGTRQLGVTQEQAWEALNDPETLKGCLPGCDKFESTGDNQYAVTMAVKVGPASPTPQRASPNSASQLRRTSRPLTRSRPRPKLSSSATNLSSARVILPIVARVSTANSPGSRQLTISVSTAAPS